MKKNSYNPVLHIVILIITIKGLLEKTSTKTLKRERVPQKHNSVKHIHYCLNAVFGFIYMLVLGRECKEHY